MKRRVVLLSTLSVLSLAVALVVSAGGAAGAASRGGVRAARTGAVTTSPLGRYSPTFARSGCYRLRLGLSSPQRPLPDSLDGVSYSEQDGKRTCEPVLEREGLAVPASCEKRQLRCDDPDSQLLAPRSGL